MNNKKVYMVRSEGDMEAVMERFYELSKTKAKKKIMQIVVPSSKLSNIVISNLNKMFTVKDMGDPKNYHVHIFLEKDEINE